MAQGFENAFATKISLTLETCLVGHLSKGRSARILHMLGIDLSDITELVHTHAWEIFGGARDCPMEGHRALRPL